MTRIHTLISNRMESVIARLRPLSTLYPLGVEQAVVLIQSTTIRSAMDCVLDAMRQHDMEPIFDTHFNLVQWDDARFALEALLVATFPDAFKLACFDATADMKSILMYEASLLLRQQFGRLLKAGTCEHMHGMTNLLKGFVLVYYFVFSVEKPPIEALIDAYNVLHALDCVFAKHWCEMTRLQIWHYVKSVICTRRDALTTHSMRAVVCEIDRQCTV